MVFVILLAESFALKLDKTVCPEIIQAPYIFNINVKYIRICIIFYYHFYLFFTLYFYFHGQQVSYGYHACITTTKSLDSFPSPKDSSENLFFRYFLHYIVAKWFEYSSVTPTSTPSIKLISVFSTLFRYQKC